MRGSALFLLASFLAGCAAPRPVSSVNAVDPQPYVRVNRSGTNRIALQIAAREFAPKRGAGPKVWLTGASHIGDTNYYAALQKQLDAQTLVLFEGVGAAEAGNADDGSQPETRPGPAERPDTRGSLQSAMAASLGLVFQLEAIDYRRRNFRNSDLSIAQLRDLMTQEETRSGQPGASESFENLLEVMDGGSWLDALLQLALRLLGSNPKFQALGRLALIDLLGQIQGDPSRLQDLPPDMKQLLEVLLQRRNEKVMTDLAAELPQIGRQGSIAVFFGTGHMPDLESRLRSELNYRPIRERWFTAFEVNLSAANVSPSEREFIDNFVKWQLQAASGSTPPKAGPAPKP